ncbi:MAG TPA: UbiA family prenyltransferase [Longimicrobiaceae bacterium]|nr:UbiA family prenyltransferase [Longimicrobiaceae bacterium]
MENDGLPFSILPSPFSIRAYLRLVRAPAVFSALADPLAGMLIARGGLAPARAAAVAASAASLYLAGMALNDVADRAEDARERPGRPIPSGAVSVTAAAGVGSALLAAGVLAARGAGAGAVGAALAGSVLAYDSPLKRTALGPAAMGACRSLSLLMGARAGAGRGGVARALPGALALGAYVAGLTVVARGETAEGGREHAAPGLEIAAAALLGAAALGGRRALPWVAAVAALAGPAALRAARDPSPASTGAAVGSMIRAIPALDAALAAPRSPLRAAAVALPLLALVRWGRKLIPIS